MEDTWEDIPLPGFEVLRPPPHARGREPGVLPGLTSPRLREDPTIPYEVIQRFNARLVHVPDDYGGCWLWPGAISSDGYGRINWTVDGKQTTMSTHRFALLTHHGVLPPGLVAEHECNQPLCCRVGPGHLRLVTQSENILRAVDDHRHDGNKLVVDSRCRRERSVRLRDAIKDGFTLAAYLDALHARFPTQEGLWD